ncbi:MAG: hypothetical protein ACKPKO_30095, partial [Candidatus Fonsibacter sp.]
VPGEAPSEGDSEGDIVGVDIYVDSDADTGEFVTQSSPLDAPAMAEVISPGVVPLDAPPLSDSESEQEAPSAPEQPGLLWPPRILDGYPCPLLNYSDQPELASGIRPAKATTPSTQDLALIEEVGKNVHEVFNKALAGTFREGTLRCLPDITGTFLDRPGGRTPLEEDRHVGKVPQTVTDIAL